MPKLVRRYVGIRFRVGKGSTDRFGRYVCQLHFCPYPGKRLYKTIKLENKSYREANLIKYKWMGEHIRRRPSQDFIEKRNTPFKQLRDVLLAMMQSTTLNSRAEPCAPSTINKTLSIFDRFFLQFLPTHCPSKKCLDELPKGIFHEYLIHNKFHMKLNWGTELGHLKAIISRLWRADYCDDRIYKEIRTLPTPKYEIKNKIVLSLDEKKSILDYMRQDNNEYYAITYLLAKLGWRIKETLSLKKKNIRFENEKPVSITIEKEFRKNRKEFFFSSIDQKISDLISEYINKLGNSSEWLFPNSSGNMIRKETYRSYLHNVSSHVLRRKINPHDFRHSLITHLKAMGVPNKDIMHITGHRDEGVLNDYYSHSTEAGRLEALKLSGV